MSAALAITWLSESVLLLRVGGLLTGFKLLLMAQERWRRFNAAHLIPLVRAGVGFTDGAQAERRSAA
jgi:hypothetical protein